MKASYYAEIMNRENWAAQRIKSDPKTFYTYEKSFRKDSSRIKMIVDEKRGIVTEPKIMADIFQDQFSSVFSNPNDADKEMPSFHSPHVARPMSDLTVTDEIILRATSQIHDFSASRDDD